MISFFELLNVMEATKKPLTGIPTPTGQANSKAQEVPEKPGLPPFQFPGEEMDMPSGAEPAGASVPPTQAAPASAPAAPPSSGKKINKQALAAKAKSELPQQQEKPQEDDVDPSQPVGQVIHHKLEDFMLKNKRFRGNTKNMKDFGSYISAQINRAGFEEWFNKHWAGSGKTVEDYLKYESREAAKPENAYRYSLATETDWNKEIVQKILPNVLSSQQINNRELVNQFWITVACIIGNRYQKPMFVPNTPYQEHDCKDPKTGAKLPGFVDMLKNKVSQAGKRAIDEGVLDRTLMALAQSNVLSVDKPILPPGQKEAPIQRGQRPAETPQHAGIRAKTVTTVSTPQGDKSVLTPKSIEGDLNPAAMEPTGVVGDKAGTLPQLLIKEESELFKGDPSDVYYQYRTFPGASRHDAESDEKGDRQMSNLQKMQAAGTIDGVPASPEEWAKWLEQMNQTLKQNYIDPKTLKPSKELELNRGKDAALGEEQGKNLLGRIQDMYVNGFLHPVNKQQMNGIEEIIKNAWKRINFLKKKPLPGPDGKVPEQQGEPELDTKKLQQRMALKQGNKTKWATESAKIEARIVELEVAEKALRDFQGRYDALLRWKDTAEGQPDPTAKQAATALQTIRAKIDRAKGILSQMLEPMQRMKSIEQRQNAESEIAADPERAAALQAKRDAAAAAKTKTGEEEPVDDRLSQIDTIADPLIQRMELPPDDPNFIDEKEAIKLVAQKILKLYPGIKPSDAQSQARQTLLVTGSEKPWLDESDVADLKKRVANKDISPQQAVEEFMALNRKGGNRYKPASETAAKLSLGLPTWIDELKEKVASGKLPVEKAIAKYQQLAKKDGLPVDAKRALGVTSSVTQMKPTSSGRTRSFPYVTPKALSAIRDALADHSFTPDEAREAYRRANKKGVEAGTCRAFHSSEELMAQMKKDLFPPRE
jgi:hypothetical protein